MKSIFQLNKILIIAISLTLITLIMFWILNPQCETYLNSCSADAFNIWCGILFAIQILTLMYWVFYIWTTFITNFKKK